jgi:hypothetical protein
MSRQLTKYRTILNSRVKKASINHLNRTVLHTMSKEELETHYKKYFSEQGNIECCLNLKNEFEQIDLDELEKYEKWLMESD